MRISRIWLFLIGLLGILALYFLQRVAVYQKSGFTHGVLICEDREALRYYETDLTLYYYVGMEEYQVTVCEKTEMAFRKVRVRYPQGHPEKGHLYTVGDFWFLSMLWLLFPVMLWGAFVFTLLEEGGRLVVSWGNTEKQK